MSGVARHLACAPATPGPEGLHGRPATATYNAVERGVVVRPDDGTRGGYRAQQVMELRLDGRQVRKDIGVIVFQVVQNGRSRAIVNKFRALIEECSVVFIGLDDK